MAEELADGEFWLPSEFLTDEDIIMDFGSSSEISDDDYLLPKVAVVLSSSPQSTLFGCECNQNGSSQETPKDEGEKAGEEKANDEKDTLDLLNKAADEVAKMKVISDSRRIIGTGFFDCSKATSNGVKGLLCPPSPSPQRNVNTPFFPPHFYSHPQFGYFPPHVMWGPVQLPPSPPPPPAQNRVTKNNTKSNNNGSNRPLGLPQSAWPPLPGQAQGQAQPISQPQQKSQPMMGGFVGPQRDSVGTGVFLPRQVALEPKNKSDGNTTKTKNNKGSQRRSSRSTKAKVGEIQLPSEWVY